MEEFDIFGETLFDEAKFLYEIAKQSKYEKEKQLYLHASLLMGISALEAYINSVCAELVTIRQYNMDLYAQSLLSEKKIELNKGVASLGNQLQMTRIMDRIEFIYNHFSHKQIMPTDQWHNDLCEAIRLRNSLVHPKDVVKLTERQIEKALNSVLQTVNVIYVAVYKNPVPILGFGLQSVKDYKQN